MAHPVRPSSYVDISNFYTTTVYEKGAEVVRMLHTLLGHDVFTSGVRLYLKHRDGQVRTHTIISKPSSVFETPSICRPQAATVEDLIGAMESVSGRDLKQFYNW
jgi:aminopeptidase N